MKKNRCQANTRKNEPCKNYAVKGSDFCHIHTEHDNVFPPVQLTAYICPYCEASLSEKTESCEFCNESFSLCPYCDEPLRRDAQFCNFCKLDRTPVQPVQPAQPVNTDYTDFTPVHSSSPAEGASLTFGILFIVPLVLFIGLLYVVVRYLYSL